MTDSAATIKITGTILIEKDCETVFNYIANLENDSSWRKEINSTSLSSKPQLNAVAIEDSYLSKRVPSNCLTLVCTEYIQNHKVVYKTPVDSPFFLESIRQVEAVSSNKTNLIYSVEFDTAIAKFGLGFSLPKFLIRFAAQRDMAAYLNKLNQLLKN